MKRGPLQVLIALDETLNAVFGGSGRQTVSARAGYALTRGKLWARLAVPMIDALFGRGHCIRQAEAEGLI